MYEAVLDSGTRANGEVVARTGWRRLGGVVGLVETEPQEIIQQLIPSVIKTVNKSGVANKVDVVGVIVESGFRAWSETKGNELASQRVED